MLAVAYSCRLLRPVVRRRRREPEDARTTLLPQSEALSGNRQHVTVVQQPVEYRRGDHRVAEHLAPFADRTVRRDQDAAALVAPRDELEEQVRGVRLEGQVAELIDKC